MASPRGNGSLRIPLDFVRFEPYVIPKKSLTGDSTERVDTRVLQVIYRVKDQNDSLYVGQQMDVYIEAPIAASTFHQDSGPATGRGQSQAQVGPCPSFRLSCWRAVQLVRTSNDHTLQFQASGRSRPLAGPLQSHRRRMSGASPFRTRSSIL